MHPPFLCDNWAIINSYLLFVKYVAHGSSILNTPQFYHWYFFTSAILFKNRKAPADTLPSGD